MVADPGNASQRDQRYRRLYGEIVSRYRRGQWTQANLAAAMYLPQGLHAAETTRPASFALSELLKLVNLGKFTVATAVVWPRRVALFDISVTGYIESLCWELMPLLPHLLHSTSDVSHFLVNEASNPPAESDERRGIRYLKDSIHTTRANCQLLDLVS